MLIEPVAMSVLLKSGPVRFAPNANFHSMYAWYGSSQVKQINFLLIQFGPDATNLSSGFPIK